jgi:hypothetical protein
MYRRCRTRNRIDVIYDDAFRVRLHGRNFGTTVTAAADGVTTVDATGGFTYEKLLVIRANFIDGGVGNQGVTPIRYRHLG